jgi:hypothetical protein
MDAQVGDNQKELLFRVLDKTLHEIDEVDKGRHVRRALVDLEPHGTAMAASGSLISTFRCLLDADRRPSGSSVEQKPEQRGPQSMRP